MSDQTIIPAVIISIAVLFFLVAVLIHVGLDIKNRIRGGITEKSAYVSDILLIVASVGLMVIIVSAIVQIYSLP